MTSIERAFQELDPLSALASRPITIGAAIGMPAFATVTTLIRRSEVDNWPLAVAALLAISASGVVLWIAASPLRAPFTLVMHVVVTGLAVLAYVLAAASMWQSNRFVRDDWGPITLGLVLLSLSQYRPPKEIAATGIALALFVGVVSLPQAHSLVSGADPIVYAIVSMTPVLALSLASAAFGRLLIDGLQRWRRRARRAESTFSDESSGWIARSVQQDRVTILNQEVIPFFAEVLQRGQLGEAERERARGISNAIRAIMVAEADRTWLDIIVNQSVGARATVSDDRRLASLMSTDQRTALRAIIVALSRHPTLEEQLFTVALTIDRSTCRATLTARVGSRDPVVRSELAPYFAVMRIVFSGLRVELSPTALTLRFSYEQR